MRGACNQSLQAVVSKLEQTLPNRVKLPFAHANSQRTSPNGFKRSFDGNQTVVGTVNPNWAARTHFFWVVGVVGCVGAAPDAPYTTYPNRLLLLSRHGHRR